MIAIPDLETNTYYRGRVALHAILKALRIEPGDEVLTQAFTCVAVPEGIMAAGAKPIWVEIEVNGYNMDPDDLESKITPRTEAIIVQHTYGIPADMERILAIAERHNIPVIEDCCHTVASTYNGEQVGSFGVGSFYSFEWGKPIVAGIGGAAVINFPALRNTVQSRYDEYSLPAAGNQMKLQMQALAHRVLYRPILYWPVRWLFHKLSALGAAESNYNPIREGHIAEDFSMRMSPVLQQRLKQKLKDVDSITAHSRQIADRYRTEIIHEDVRHPSIPPNSDAVFARYPLIVEKKPALLRAARRANVELAEWYATPIHPLEEADWSLVHYAAGSCPHAERRCKQVVTLPTHSAVGSRDVSRAIDFLNTVAV